MMNLLALLPVLLCFVRSALRSRADLMLENVALRQQVAALKRRNQRPRLSWSDRAFRVCLLSVWDKWRSVLIIVRPETVLRWHRQRFKRHWLFLSRPPKGKGRPGLDYSVRDLIRKMARKNPTWGAPRIHGELQKLGFDVSERTVSRYLPRRTPDKTKRQTWLTFLRNHRHAIAAMDFFTVPTATFRILYVFFVIHQGRREICPAPQSRCAIA